MTIYKTVINGQLDIIVTKNEDEFEGTKEYWDEVLIHGDPEGLRSLAELLLQLANLNQDDNLSLPLGAREHLHLRPKFELSKSSVPVIVGRLDAKGSGDFYNHFVSNES